METTGKKQVRGIRNKNPLNIKHGASWKGMCTSQSDPDFIQFESMTMGCRAALVLMRNHIEGFKGTRPKMNTLRKLISVWAPPTENSTERYINHVAGALKMNPNDIIDSHDRTLLTRIASEMAVVECGQRVDEKYFKSAWDYIV